MMSISSHSFRGLYMVLAACIIVLLWLRYPINSKNYIHNPNYGALNETTSTSRYAVATFLAGNTGTHAAEGSDQDDYFVATRVLVYQLLHAPETRCRDRSIPILVLVTAAVSEIKRQQLRLDGAIIVPVQDVPLRWWVKTGVTRWKDVFGKLRLYEMTGYDRILYLDADTLITEPVDAIFDDPLVRMPAKILLNRTNQLKTDELPLPAQYVFAARSDNALTGKRAHPYPPLKTEVFTAGFWVIAPSKEMYNYFQSVMDHYRRFDPHEMEQSLMNYAYRRTGAMPWAEIDYKWSATWPNEADLAGGVVTMHEKLWKTGPEHLMELWSSYKMKMDEHYDQGSR